MTKEFEMFVINDLITDVQKNEAFNIIERKKKMNIFGTILYHEDKDDMYRFKDVMYSHAVSDARRVFEDNKWKYFVTVTTLDNVKGQELETFFNTGVNLSTDCDFVVIPAGNREMIGSVLNIHLRTF